MGFSTTPTPNLMHLVILVSSYDREVKANSTYTRASLRDCLVRDQAPIASHFR